MSKREMQITMTENYAKAHKEILTPMLHIGRHDAIENNIPTHCL